MVFASCELGVDCSEPAPVLMADLPDNGWYWAADSDDGVSGWGVNIEIQQSLISSSGYYLFGAFYTFDEDGKAIWYTFASNYLANEDVYAWREGNGNMGTINTDVYLSSGGSCLTCIPNIASSVTLADTGPVSITWKNPFEAQVQIGAVTHNISRFKFHNGVGNQDVSFITEGWWQVYYQSKLSLRNMYNEPLTTYPTMKGLAKFVPLDTSIFEPYNVDFYNPEHQYYVSSEINFLQASNFYSYGEKFIVYTPRQLLIDYDPQTHILLLHYFDINKSYEIDECNYIIGGYLRPSGSHNSMFYAEYDDRCEFKDLYELENARASFAFMSHLGNAGDALVNNGLFSFSQ
jgi:hypothetical protein